MDVNPTLSVILPFYKQNDHAQAVIEECKRAVEDLNVPFEIIAVYNGMDLLGDSHREKISKGLIQLFSQQSGWGFAVKKGISEAKGDYICYTNSARTDMKELVRLAPYAFLSDKVIVKATRIHRDTFLRRQTSKFYNLSNRLILTTPIWDVNATPKFFPKMILEQIGPFASNGDSIDAEILYRAHQKGIPIVEIPSNHVPRRGGTSTTRILFSGMKMLGSLLRIRFR